MDLSNAGGALCPLPFLLVDINPQGKYSACCDSACSPSATVKNLSAGEWFFSDELQALRDTFLAGQSPIACKGCYTREAEGLLSKRQMSIESFNTGLYGNTLENIWTRPEVRFVNYRFGNDCNLACIMCCSDSSTTFGREEEQLNGRPLEKFSNPLRMTDDELKKLTSIYLGGGEPAMSKSYLQLLDRLIQLQHTQLNITLHTNGTLPRAALFQKLKKFSDVTIYFSIDGTEETYNLIRYPMRWDSLHTNIETFLRGFPTFAYGINFSLCCLNAANTPEFLRWWVGMNERFDSRIPSLVISDVYGPTFLDLNLMADADKTPTLNRLQELLATTAPAFRAPIELVIKRISSAQRPANAEKEDRARHDFIQPRLHLRAQSPEASANI